jgi:hypothetical protein
VIELVCLLVVMVLTRLCFSKFIELSSTRVGGMTQVIEHYLANEGPEFKPQYRQKNM